MSVTLLQLVLGVYMILISVPVTVAVNVPAAAGRTDTAALTTAKSTQPAGPNQQRHHRPGPCRAPTTRAFVTFIGKPPSRPSTHHEGLILRPPCACCDTKPRRLVWFPFSFPAGLPGHSPTPGAATYLRQVSVVSIEKER